MRVWSSLLLLSFLCPVLSHAQTPVIPRTGENIEVSIVNVDTVVTDSRGERVRGLGRDDFEIYENGVRQPLTNFAEYAPVRAIRSEVTGGVPAEAAPQPPPPQRRSIILFVERFELPHFRSDPLFASLKNLLHKSVRPGDRVMVVSWNRGLVGMQQNFTDDLSKVDETLDKIAARTTSMNLDIMSDLRHELDSIHEFEAESDAFGSGGSASLGDSGLSFFSEQDVRTKAKMAFLDEKRKVETLKALIRSISSADGKKVLLLATHRLSEFAGAEAFFMAGASQLAAEIKNEFDAKPLMASLVETANANGVTIYPVYAEGLGSTSMPVSDSPGRLSSGFDYLVLNNEIPMLDYVAKQTGGVSAWGSPEVANLFSRVGDDFESYYSLAYRATPGKLSARKVEVRLKDPKLSVRSRKQFIPRTEVSRMEDRVIGALFGNAPVSTFAFVVTNEAPRRDKNKTYRIPVAVEIPIGALTSLRGQNDVYNGAFSVYLAWASAMGGASETQHATQQFSIPAADLARAKAGHFTYTMSVDSLTPALRVAFGVYDEVSHEYAVKLVHLEPSGVAR
jgi:VWFA-related protein